jgi:hypothetical protein
MAISTYAELQTAVANWLDRDDLTARIPEFITLAEAKIRRVARVEYGFTAVSTDDTILATAPDIYLYGALLEATPYLEHDERIRVWQQKFEEALAEHNQYVRRATANVPITNATTLYAAVDNWLGRDDLTARVPDFVVLAEAEMRRELRAVVVRDTIQLATEEVDLGATVSQLRSIVLQTGTPSQDKPLRIVTPEQLAERRAELTEAGRPKYASIVNGKLVLVPAPDDTYDADIIYFAAVDPLATTATNAILSAHPDVYLFGALSMAALYLPDEPRGAMWSQRFSTAIAQINTARQRAEYGASLRPARLPVVLG